MFYFLYLFPHVHLFDSQILLYFFQAKSSLLDYQNKLSFLAVSYQFLEKSISNIL